MHLKKNKHENHIKKECLREFSGFWHDIQFYSVMWASQASRGAHQCQSAINHHTMNPENNDELRQSRTCCLYHLAMMLM